jgi:hypothetical protein
MSTNVKKIFLVGLLVKYSIKEKFLRSYLQLSKFGPRCYTSCAFALPGFFAIHRADSHCDFDRAGGVLSVGEEALIFGLCLNVLLGLNLV